MNSISRAVTSKISEFSNKRQRLVTDVGDFENPGWTDATTSEFSEFNYFDPPNIVIQEEEWKETPLRGTREDVKEDLGKALNSPPQKSPSVKITKKMTSVVRKLSPFNQGHTSKELKEQDATETASNESEKKNKLFKDTRGKVEKIRKSFQSKDQVQLIESEDEA